LSIPSGICFGIFGPNGSGKTTFLKIVATLVRPTSGTVEVAGTTLPRNARKVRAQTGVVLHHPLLPRNFTLLEGLRYYADLYQIDNPEPRIHELLERMGLTWRRRDPVATFSRGMAQSASLACALLSEPPLLLLDEPFSGLDQRGCDLVEEVIQEYRKAQRTVLLVTHELERGERLADEVVVLDQGRVVFRGERERWELGDLTAVYR
ncbi:MAG: ABC transporter ATP-binding protein, partial [Planctomycetota bacterium]